MPKGELLVPKPPKMGGAGLGDCCWDPNTNWEGDGAGADAAPAVKENEGVVDTGVVVEGVELKRPALAAKGIAPGAENCAEDEAAPEPNATGPVLVLNRAGDDAPNSIFGTALAAKLCGGVMPKVELVWAADEVPVPKVKLAAGDAALAEGAGEEIVLGVKMGWGIPNKEVVEALPNAGAVVPNWGMGELADGISLPKDGVVSLGALVADVSKAPNLIIPVVGTAGPLKEEVVGCVCPNVGKVIALTGADVVCNEGTEGKMAAACEVEGMIG
eukprot:TRINITY_DN4609_c0_g6_i1.p2 TRINITY_DN4609_c0_g6~~TRINITY_DN4609_c0_g6_i1.p2  ORF type:complete len:272 (+),score=57.61 TRINITY_DN4609_c0_g6_i1:337-1152(+)